MTSGCSTNASAKIQKPDEVRAVRKSQLRTITVYYANDKGYMVPLTYTYKEPLEDPVRVAVEKLIEGPNSQFMARTLPKDTRLKNCYVSNDTAFLDFSGNFNDLRDSQAAAMAVKSLCLTLGYIPGIEHVQILIDGQTVDSVQGVSMEQLLKHNWVNYGGDESPKSKYEVFFADSNAMFMVPVTYGTDCPEGLPRQAMERLLHGPDSDELCATIWPGTKLLGLKIENGTAVVDLSKEATGYGGGTTAEGLFVKSVLLTLGQFSDIREVQILIDSKKTELLPEGTQIGTPLEIPAYVNIFPEGGS